MDDFVRKHYGLFRTPFSAGPDADVQPLQVDFVSDARPARLKLRQYSSEQRDFLQRMIYDLSRCGMVYANPKATWVSAPLLVAKPGSSRFRFSVDLRPVNRHTLNHGYPMYNIEQELVKVGSSRVYATFDPLYGYWQFTWPQIDKNANSS